MDIDLYDHPELYDALLPVGAHLPFYLDLASQHRDGVLELACGTGQIAVPIAAAGIRTCGLDRSGTMLATARSRAESAGVALNLVEGDMRNFEFDDQFGLIFIARNSLLHLSSARDLVSTFDAVRRHLAPGGVFVFDVFSPDVRLLARPVVERFPVMTIDTVAFGEVTVEGSQHYDAAEQIVHARWHVSLVDQRDKWTFPLIVRCIFPQELALLVEAAGLRLVDRFGGLSRQPFGSESRLQVCLCAASD